MAILKTQGFTLVEMVIAIVITGIVAGMASLIILNPLRTFVAVSERVELMDSLEYALQSMSRDFHAAVPNSVRVDKNQHALEFVHTVAGARYRTGGDPEAALNFDAPDDSFYLLGTDLVAENSDAHYQLVIYNTGEYALDENNEVNYNSPSPEVNLYYPGGSYHVITPKSTELTFSKVDNQTKVSLSPAHQFALPSRLQRAYIVDTPVTYLCDLIQGTLKRYSNYEINAVQPNQGDSSVFDDATEEVLLENVTECSFKYQPSLVLQAPIVTIELGTTSEHDESIKLIKRLQVKNAS
jgi:MSHA biogenesis protein MshO